MNPNKLIDISFNSSVEMFIHPIHWIVNGITENVNIRKDHFTVIHTQRLFG
jgi:hypothetical protein